MIDCYHLREVVQANEPAIGEQIIQVEGALGCAFPRDYFDLLACSNGFNVPDVLSLSLYSTEELVERNTTYEVALYMPGWVMIGDDGGGRGIVIDCTQPQSAIYRVGMGVMQAEEAVYLAASLAEWIKSGFDLKDDPPSDKPAFVDVWLVRMPAKGPKALLDLKKQLAIETSMGELHRGLMHLPVRLLRSVPYGRYSTQCSSYNSTDDCLRLFEVDNPEQAVEM
jgi:cell wall assembly regulator SMI1